jgi:hypothetical protein
LSVATSAKGWLLFLSPLVVDFVLSKCSVIFSVFNQISNGKITANYRIVVLIFRIVTKIYCGARLGQAGGGK